MEEDKEIKKFIRSVKLTNLVTLMSQYAKFSTSVLTVVEWKDYHFLAVATVSDLQNSYCNQWPHPYEPQISSRFVFSAVCLHFTAILVKFSEKTSAIKTMCLWTKSSC